MRLPRTRAALVKLLQAEYTRGFQAGLSTGRTEASKQAAEEFKNREAEANLKALNGVGQMMQSMSQAVEAACRAMYSGRGM